MDQDLKLGLISNTFVHATALDRHLEQLGLLAYFPIRLYSYQFPFRKPDPRLFQVGSDQIGEDFKHILYVGDRIDNDLRPSLALGMVAALKKSYSSEGKSIPSGAWVIDKISELPALIRAYNDQFDTSNSILPPPSK
jgi:FMN phosphatase YigB (HAD superfamily)